MKQTAPSAGALRGNSRGEATRARLLYAALQAFAARGFHGTSTRDIAEAAGMSPAAVYVHYRSKEELLFELSLAGHRTALNVIEEAAAASSGPAAQLHAVTSAYTAWHARAHTQARVVQYEMAALHPEHTSEIIQIRRTIESHVRAIILAGIESGVFDVRDPRMTTLAILSLGIDVARWYRDDGTWTPEKIGEQYGQFALQLAAYQAG